MKETTEQTIINKENYDSVKNMLLSNDKASVKVGLSILEQSDFEESKVYIMSLLVSCYDSVIAEEKHSFLKEEYTELNDRIAKEIENVDKDSIAQLSLKNIYEIALKRKNKEELEFVTQILTDKFSDLLIDYGFSFMEYFDVKLTPKK